MPGQVIGARSDSPARDKLGSPRKTSPAKPASLEYPGARLTGIGLLLCLAYLGIPVLLLGNLADFLVQWLFGWCVGFWCVF